MRIIDKSLVRRSVVAVAATLVLAGCETGQNRAPDYAENTNQIRSVALRHDVLFVGNSTKMTKAAREDLSTFVKRADLKPSDRIVISAPAMPGKPMTKVAQARVSQVGRFFTFRGTKVQLAGHAAQGMGARIIRVSIHRSVVVAPDCPDWDTAVAGAVLNGRPDRFGCMNAAALAAMVADPNDLKRGRRLEHGDGDYQTRWLRNYRAGKSKAPTATQTQK